MTAWRESGEKRVMSGEGTILPTCSLLKAREIDRSSDRRETCDSPHSALHQDERKSEPSSFSP